jgi:hypothetical protein
MSPVRRIRTSCTEVVSSLQDVESHEAGSQNGITKTKSSNPAGIPRKILQRRQEDAITLSITYPYETYTTTVLLGNTLQTSSDPAPSQLLPTRSEEFHIPSPPSTSQFPTLTERNKLHCHNSSIIFPNLFWPLQWSDRWNRSRLYL